MNGHMKDLEHTDEVLKAGLRRKLTLTEESQLQAYFAAHPEERSAWEEEVALNQLLRQLPDAPVSTNFTAQVLSLVENERNRPASARPAAWWPWASPLPWARGTALASVALVIGLFSYHQYQLSYREEVVRSAATLSTFASLPMDLLENFEAIERLSQVPQKVYVELLAALQSH